MASPSKRAGQVNPWGGSPVKAESLLHRTRNAAIAKKAMVIAIIATAIASLHY
jgi:hypothetical protein